MRPLALRQLLLVMLAGIAGPGCAKEDLLMHKVDVHEVFADAGVAALAEAIADENSAQVHRLARAVNLDSQGDDRVTLLQWAILSESVVGLEALLQEGANPALQGMDGYTAIHTAAMVEDPAYLEILLKHGVDPNTRNSEGQTPLFTAITGKRDAQFEALLKAGANPNTADSVGDTPLHIAGSINDPARALALLRAGANPAAINSQRVTFQDYLFQANPRLLNEQAKRDREAISTWLVDHGVAVKPEVR